MKKSILLLAGLVAVSIALVGCGEKQEAQGTENTSDRVVSETLSTSDSPEAEQKYVKEVVDELLRISNEVSTISQYDFDNIPRDTEAFKSWGYPIKSKLDYLQLHVLLANPITGKYLLDSYTPPKFREIHNRVLSSIYNLQEYRTSLYEAIDSYKINDVKESAQKFQEQGEGLKKLADEIVKVANYQQ